MGKITYESICEKLGFDVDTRQPPLGDTEDANGDSPYYKLTDEELDFVTKRIESRQKE